MHRTGPRIRAVPVVSPALSTDDRILLAQISDLHIGAGVGNADPARRTEQVVAALSGLDPAPDAVIVTGDLTQLGEPGEYDRVRELLAPLEMPVHTLPGNHDVRAALHDALLADVATGPREFLQYEARVGRLRLLVCDTIIPGEDGGRLCAERLGWLEAALAADRETATIVAMHHPPLTTGIEAMDEIGLEPVSRAQLAAVLDRAPNVLRVIAGHVHRPMYSTCGGRTVFSCPSADVAIRLDLRHGAELGVLDEPPAYALHLVTDGTLVTHIQPLP
jgi:3',5'-cyclic-AMP phosphodiesterase